MEHQSELEQSKYRNWVRGGLAYKYLKDGLEGFADDVVSREHRRILQTIKHKTGVTCNQCSLRSLKPLHKSVKDPGKMRCPWSQTNCNCMYSKKQACPKNVCDSVFEEILKSHGSSPPAPNWKNTDIQNWCSSPWEVAKCFINAPGYSDKSSAADIDATGLLHLFINNTNLHFSCANTGTDIINKTIKSRNAIFHSPKMELEQAEMHECIDNVVQLLEDDKELKERPEAKEAVGKLKQLKQDNFIITTHNEAEVCRAAMAAISIRSEELKQVIEDAKADIKLKHKEIAKGINETTQRSLDESLEKLEKRNESMLETMEQTIKLLKERVSQLELDNTDIKQRLTEIEDDREKLKAASETCKRQLEYIDQKLVLQRKLVERYEKYYVKTWVSPLKCQEDEINIDQVYVTPNMVVEGKKVHKTDSKTRSKDARHVNRDSKSINTYRDMFQTNDSRYKKIYIVGGVGTGKSSFCKMMIHNWCKSVTERQSNQQEDMAIHSNDTAEESNIKTMAMFDFLFFVPLQRMSGFRSDIFEMMRELYKDILQDNLLKRIFDEESDNCCIIADGLDEWTIPQQFAHPTHISHGIPNGDRVNNATTITLSRPSAKGILNLRSSEFDRKVELSGVNVESVSTFARKYMAIQTSNEEEEELSSEHLDTIIETGFKHLKKTPMLLQQLVWLYCHKKDIGNSFSKIYSNILNIMLGWSENKEEDGGYTDDTVNVPKEFEGMELPERLKEFPRCETNQRFIFILSKLSFEALTGSTATFTLGRSKLRNCGLSKADIASLIKFGILEECNNFDTTLEQTCFSFIHLSYLEFFAAVYVSIGCHALTNGSQAKKRKTERIPLQDIFLKCTSTADILQMSNLLLMIYGLSPFLVGELFNLISKTLKIDKRLISHREDLLESEIEEPELILNLLTDCCVESEDFTAEVCLSDIILTDCSMMPLNQINTKEVLSLCIEHVYTFDCDFIKWIERLQQLQFACIEIDEVECEDFDKLLEALKHIASLKQLFLYNRYYCNNLQHLNISCREHFKCNGHSVDLSKHDQLTRIHFECVTCFDFIGNPPKNLQRFYKSSSSVCRCDHFTFKDLSKYLEKATSLRDLTISDIECDDDCTNGHSINLSQHRHLHDINITCFTCTLGPAENLTNLETFVMINSSSEMEHEMCEQLASSLSKAIELKVLILEDVGCDFQECNSHKIDLSNHDKLETVDLINCSFSAENSKIDVNTE